MYSLSLLLATMMNLPPFGEVRLVDEVDCTLTDHGFRESPAGTSEVTEILGERCRHLAVQPEETSSYFSYRLGAGCGLKASGAYVVVLEYPDDQPRNYVLHNRATGSDRGFSTGSCYGDADKAKYVDNHVESLDIPQSGKWQRWTAFSPLVEAADDGFEFVVAQYSRNHDPISNGIAVRRLLLCEIPDEEAVAAKPVMPPEPLPQRHIFWREEMSDGKITLEWVRHKCRQMRLLGINAYMKDLLEFGHVQHWDPHWLGENWMWGSDREKDYLWERIVKMVNDEFGFTVMPYYEWSGPLGLNNMCRTLGGEEHYTHITWSEASIDITAPEALEATKRLMDGTILRFRNDARFIGALFRTRPTQWAISFSDEALARFGTTRERIAADHDVYDRYIAWWHLRRAEFLAKIQAYLADNGVSDAVVLLDGDFSEPGPAEGVGRDVPTATWDKWEWQHACPADCPADFPKKRFSALAMPVNRMYSVADPDVFSAYANADGMTTIIRHQPLNEHLEDEGLGYTMNDTERAGRASVMLEVQAMANGDIGNIGYLIGSSFSRGFPAVAREFNLNFLALPAMRSRMIDGASSAKDVVLREIDCGEYGRYYALVHTGMKPLKGVRIQFPKGSDSVEFLVGGKTAKLHGGCLELELLKPWQLIAIRR